ncbi:uncharacterized [Tachysurus ichikawai]
MAAALEQERPILSLHYGCSDVVQAEGAEAEGAEGGQADDLDGLSQCTDDSVRDDEQWSDSTDVQRGIRQAGQLYSIDIEPLLCRLRRELIETLAVKLGIRSVRVAQKLLTQVLERPPQDHRVSLNTFDREEDIFFPEQMTCGKKRRVAFSPL